MKINISILAFFICICSFSQSLFEVNSDSPNFPPKEVFIDISDLSAQENYELVKDWLSTNFYTGKNLTVDQKCSNFLVFSNEVKDLYEDNSHLFKNDYDVKYELAFRCIDNRISIEINDLKVHFPETISSGGWEDISIAYEDLIRKNGEINMGKKETLERLQNHFKEVVFGLETYIQSHTNTSITYSQNK